MAAFLTACASGGDDDGNQDPPDAAVDLCINVDCSMFTDQCNRGVCNAQSGQCEPEPREDGTVCGSTSNTECDNPDVCVAGVCEPNYEESGTLCGDVGVDCQVDDTCDGVGNCVDNGTASAGTTCGDIGVPCLNDDTCDAGGNCIDNGFRVAGAACGDPSTSECDFPDSCDGAGTCLTNPRTAGTPCGVLGVDCQVDDTCNGAGACVDNGPSAIGTPCGNQAVTQCTMADTCDGAGGCLDNHTAMGTPCGDQGVDCRVDDTCNGAGFCTDNGFQPIGTPCGDPTAIDCSAADSCDAMGVCLANDLTDGTLCDDCPLGSGQCDSCEAGVCLNAGDCQEAGTIACGGIIAGNNGGPGSTNRVDNYPGCTAALNTGPEIAYRFIPDGDGAAVATITGLTANVDLFVVEAVSGSCSSTTCLASSRFGGTTDELVQWDAVAGTEYFVIVDGVSGSTSNFTLSISTPVEFIVLSEVSGGLTDYVEVQNLSACRTNLDRYSIRHRGDCDTAPQDFEFSNMAIIEPSGTFRVVDNTIMFPQNEELAPNNICDFEDGTGHTMLCDGTCNITTCSNVIDYVERSNGAGTIGGPSCVNFNTPLNTTGTPVGQTTNRTGLIGGPPNFVNSDWEFLPQSRTYP